MLIIDMAKSGCYNLNKKNANRVKLKKKGRGRKKSKGKKLGKNMSNP